MMTRPLIMKGNNAVFIAPSWSGLPLPKTNYILQCKYGQGRFFLTNIDVFKDCHSHIKDQMS